ncbi:hypothetical protein Bca52824_082522 [Brassica carinata]|uniref:Uncharacterized protein n=1 Tax=Brassica carinata TaxID=52824 RepID=A0A8X7PIA0_BRACI|nr:hypothetical protein Bca52824_082522 [Brassica carinata]
MDSSTCPVLSHASESPGKIGSSIPNKMDRTLDLESGTNHELSKLVPGMWRFPTNPDLCCIYRVPDCLRESRGDITKAKSLGYLNTEEHKKIYLAKFAKRVEGNKVVEELKRKIKEDEDMIRASYSESTAWIDSPDFVEMILHDSIFIIELMLRDEPPPLILRRRSRWGTSSVTQTRPSQSSRGGGLPTTMTVMELVRQPGRESLQRLDPNYLIVPNTTWFDLSGNGITNSLLRMEYTMLKRGYPTFYDMPEKDQELWFRQFAIKTKDTEIEFLKQDNAEIRVELQQNRTTMEENNVLTQTLLQKFRTRFGEDF